MLRGGFAQIDGKPPRPSFDGRGFATVISVPASAIASLPNAKLMQALWHKPLLEQDLRLENEGMPR